MENIIAEIRNAKEELKAGRYDEAYVMLQNVDDELTSREIKKCSNEWNPESSFKHQFSNDFSNSILRKRLLKL